MPLFPGPRNVREKGGKKRFNGYHPLLWSLQAPAGGTLCWSFPGPGTSEKKQAKSVSTSTIHCCALHQPLPAAHFAALSQAPEPQRKSRQKLFNGYHPLLRSLRAPAGGTLCRSFPGPGTSETKQAKSFSTGTIHCCGLYEPLPAAHFDALSQAPEQVSRCRTRGFQPAGWEALCRSIYYDALILC